MSPFLIFLKFVLAFEIYYDAISNRLSILLLASASVSVVIEYYEAVEWSNAMTSESEFKKPLLRDAWWGNTAYFCGKKDETLPGLKGKSGRAATMQRPVLLTAFWKQKIKMSITHGIFATKLLTT